MINIKYINTDLEIRSEEDVSSIIKSFGNRVYVLHKESNKNSHFASFEINSGVIDANSTANYFCSLVEEFPDGIRAIWDNCESRILDMGYESYESGKSPKYYQSELKYTTVQKIAKAGMSIFITIYPLSEKNTIDS